MIKQLIQGKLTNLCAVCPNAKLQPSGKRYCASICAQTTAGINHDREKTPIAHTASAYNRNNPPVFRIIEGAKPYPTLVNRTRVSRTVKPSELPKILSIRDAYKMVGQ